MYWKDYVILTSDWIRGFSRYPGHMLGRHMETFAANPTAHPRILVIAAHPDDETIGLGATIIRHRKSGASIDVLFTTNGRGWSWIAPHRVLKHIVDRRRLEAETALGMAGISSEHIHCLGFPDRGLHRFLKPLTKEIRQALQSLHPDLIYTQGFEGGHIDHDITSLVVQEEATLAGIPVYEWAEYSPEYEIGAPDITFPQWSHQFSPPIRQILSSEESWLKAIMLKCYASEEPAQQAVGQGEALRISCPDALPLLLNQYYHPERNPVGHRYYPLMLSLLDHNATRRIARTSGRTQVPEV